jgi:membrane-anchored protein YejM (alkaline phosphatase superfamily)
VTQAWLRALLVAGGAAIAIANALTLKGDYFAHHLLTAWLAALLVGRGLEGLPLPALSRARAALCLGVSAGLGVLSVALPPKGDVRLRLYELPSSVLAPLTARFLSDEQGITPALVAEKYRNSPWFRERKQLGPIAPTRAIVPAKPPIVMLFTIDAFRADVMENPEHRADLPELERLRKASTYFTVARSPTASTMTTMASVFSGRYYTQLHWSTEKASPLIEPTPRFPELVAEQGVRTLLVAGTLGQIYGKSGVARGFSTEVAVPPKRKPATVAVDAIIAELDKQPDGPQLIYSHFIEPHAPYDLAGKKGSQFARYLREIRLVDTQLARLRAYLEEKGLAERTYLLISADHGEGFGEHGTFNHAATAYEELVRVPLFFYLPGRAGRTLDTPVSLMDVGPTVLDLFGLPTPGFWMGQSLLPLAAGTRAKLERPIIVDTGRRVQAFCFEDGIKVIFARTKHTTEAYDLKRDPRELVNLAGKGDPAIDAAVQTADLFFRGIGLPEMDQDFRE